MTKANGMDSEYHVVVSPAASFVVAQDNDGDIYLIRQYRYAVSEYSIEIPAGSTEGKDPLAAAQRELQEETGLIAKKWEKLGEFYSANGLMEEKSHVYHATNLTQTGKNEMAEEGIDRLIKTPLKKAIKMIKNGEIHDGQTISSLMLYASKKNLIKQ